MQKKFDPNAAMPHRRFRLIALGITRVIVNIIFRLKFEGLENLPPHGPAIISGNHTSLMDMLTLSSKVRPWIDWVSKKELFQNWLMNGFYSRLGCIPVDRHKTDLLAARGIISALKANDIVGIFPQGTRVKPENIPYIIPRSGAIHFAIKTGVPILPVGIEGRFRLFGKVRFVFGPPIQLGLDPHGHYSNQELHELTLNLMRQIYALIGVDYQLDASLEVDEIENPTG